MALWKINCMDANTLACGINGTGTSVSRSAGPTIGAVSFTARRKRAIMAGIQLVPRYFASPSEFFI